MGLGRRRSSAVQRYLDRRGAETDSDAEAAVPEPVYGLPTQHTLAPPRDVQGAPVPDLLHSGCSARIDLSAARRALEFAFAAGDSAGVATGALSSAALAESLWQPDSFADELFLEALIEGVLTFDIDGRPAQLHRGYLRRLLTHPPRDLATVMARQEVLRELRERPSLRAALEEVYAKLAEILRLLDASGGESRYGMPRWRLDLLTELRALFEAANGPFAEAESLLSRLHDYADHVMSGDGYRELCALLDFEGDAARVDLQVRIGADGRVRELHTLAVRSGERAAFREGFLGRLRRRWICLMRGYQLSEVAVSERWLEHVFAGLLPDLPALLQLRGDLEFYLAGCHFAALAESKGLAVSIPELSTEAGRDSDQVRHLAGLFNPLLLRHSRSPVPCDLQLDSFRRCCILTGPNSGGKTRLLQALALTQMLGQAGLFVPAERALLRPASGMFVSLGHPTSADADEGRLGTELRRIRRLFEAARPHCLIVLDELCSGTNPSEGEEIFYLVVDLLRELSPEVYITTHFLQFAASLQERKDALALCFLQVDLDEQRVPTYQFVSGVASTSLAQQTAARLGVSRDELLALIRRNSKR